MKGVPGGLQDVNLRRGKPVTGRFVPIGHAVGGVVGQPHLLNAGWPVGPGSLREPLHQDELVEWALEPKPPREVVADPDAVDPDGADSALADWDGLLADTAG